MTPPKRIPSCGVVPYVGPKRKNGCRMPEGHVGPHGAPRTRLAKTNAGKRFVKGWEFWQNGGRERSFVERPGQQFFE